MAIGKSVNFDNNVSNCKQNINFKLISLKNKIITAILTKTRKVFFYFFEVRC